MNSGELIKSVLKEVPNCIFTSEKTYKKRKLKMLLKKANEESLLYRNLYKDVDIEKITPETIDKLPAISKTNLLEDYDNWVCDRDVKKAELKKFSSVAENINNLYLDKYVVASTSGTTGEKLYVPTEAKEFNHMMTLGALYTWPKKSYALDILKSKRPIVYLIPTDGFYTSLMISNTYLGFSKNKGSAIIDFRTPTEELVKRINEINPILIGGYANSLLILADEVEKGRLKVDTKYVVPIGSVYNREAREKVARAFNCKTFTSYSCTEGGEIGCECVNGHYHISRDVLIEAVDDDLNPVKDGEESKSILITNLWNTSSPFIRYRINDRCTIHGEPCGCGRKSKWIEVKGRDMVKVSFTDKSGQKIQMSDSEFEIVLYELNDGYVGIQIIIDGDTVDVRKNGEKEFENTETGRIIKEKLDKIFETNNLNLKVIFSGEDPKVEESGKMKPIYIVPRVN